MSGFEIAGIALAILPICSAAINGYASTMSAARAFKNRGGLVSEYTRRLEVHAAHIQFTVRLLYLPFVARADIEHMLQDHRNSLWTDSHVVTQLKTRHGSLYELFERRINDLTKSLARLVYLLGLAKSSDVSGL